MRGCWADAARISAGNWWNSTGARPKARADAAACHGSPPRSNEYIKALVIAEQQKIQFRKLEDVPPWPKAQELADLQARIEESTRRYEAGTYSAERYFPSLARMEARRGGTEARAAAV